MTKQELVDYALMAGAAYDSERGDINQIPYPSGDGWQPLSQNAQQIISGDGFQAAAFQNGDNIVISFAGTNESQDWLTNAALGLGFSSPQLIDAALFYEQIKKDHPRAVISFTGHSLGGGLAALMGVYFNRQAVTFDPAPFRKSATIANQALTPHVCH